MDPSLTLYGAAVHNAHVACCEVVIGGLLSAIEDGAIDRPADLPSGAAHPPHPRLHLTSEYVLRMSVGLVYELFLRRSSGLFDHARFCNHAVGMQALTTSAAGGFRTRRGCSLFYERLQAG